MKTLDELKAELNNLHNQLTRENFHDVVIKIKEVETQIKAVKRQKAVNEINAKWGAIRETARQVFEAEIPESDISTNGGYFHAAKVKRYPKLAALEYVCGVNFDGDTLTEMRVNGHRFDMVKATCNGNEKTYSRPETFNDFLTLNNIPANDLTVEKIGEIETRLNELNEQLRRDIEKYKSGLKSLDIYQLNYWGVADQRNEHLYIHRLNF